MLFRVGRVVFINAERSAKVRCAICGMRVAPEDAARHARRRHPGQSDGVLAGQLGLPGTETPDVPG